MIKIIYFSRFRDQLGLDQEQLEIPRAGCSVAELKAMLGERNDVSRQVFTADNLLVAVNHAMADVSTRIKPGDEVGIFPPVTGG